MELVFRRLVLAGAGKRAEAAKRTGKDNTKKQGAGERETREYSR